MRVAVLDMQPIDPAIGGGRLRLLGLYHALGDGIDVRYVGSFDWPGEKPRTLRLSPTLVESDVPLSPEHFEQDRIWRELAGGATVIDTTFPILGRLSPGYASAAREALEGADVAVMSHPWSYPLVHDRLDRARQLLVYDAQNAEGLLRWKLLGERPFNREIAKGVVVAETVLARAADLVVACSGGDAEFFERICGVDPARIHVAANGVFTLKVTPPDEASRAAARRALAQPGTTALFVASNYPPNVEAARFIAEALCPRFPDVTFAACGGVGDNPAVAQLQVPNFLVTGTVSEETKNLWLQAADLAINPMFSGSGTNIKMFEFMAAGLPVLATPVGARGIADRSRAGIVVAAPGRFVDSMRELLESSSALRAMGRANRAWAEEEFSWERLSPGLGARLRRALEGKRARPSHSRSGGGDAGRGRPLSKLAMPEAPIAIFSTWGVQCGIAEYSAHLCSALEGHGARFVIIGNEASEAEIARTGSHQDVSAVQVHRLWRWDNVGWTGSRIDLDAVRRVLRESGCCALSVQYHPSFFPVALLVELLRGARELGLPVTITLHNSGMLGDDQVAALVREGGRIVVHKRREAERLESRHPGAVHHLRFGIVRPGRLPDPPRREGSPGPVIATFGFLRPHKGLLQLLRSLQILRGVFPSIRLVAKCSLYPAEDSRLCHQEVLDFLRQSDLDSCVELDTGFHGMDEVLAALSGADLVVLPYAPSDEGASGSLATVMAAGRPVLVARSPIFEDYEDDVYVAESNEPEPLAAAIATLLAHDELLGELGERARRAVERAEWSGVALEFAALLGTVGPDAATPTQGASLS